MGTKVEQDLLFARAELLEVIACTGVEFEAEFAELQQ